MKTLHFEKEKGGWFIVLPEWTGSKADLAMVAGADKLLDVLALGANKVSLKVAQAPIDDFYRLTLKEYTPKEGGAIYKTYGNKDFPKEIWLCDVTKFVFAGYMPTELYFRRIY